MKRLNQTLLSEQILWVTLWKALHPLFTLMAGVWSHFDPVSCWDHKFMPRRTRKICFNSLYGEKWIDFFILPYAFERWDLLFTCQCLCWIIPRVISACGGGNIHAYLALLSKCRESRNRGRKSVPNCKVWCNLNSSWEDRNFVNIVQHPCLPFCQEGATLAWRDKGLRDVTGTA